MISYKSCLLWEECLALPEVKALIRFKDEENIAELKDIVMGNDLQTWLLRNRVGLFQESEIRGWCRQIFRVLTQMNQPDFGQAREVESQTPCSDYVTTRWYSAAEVLLNSSPYNSALYSFTPLFPGSNQAGQLKKICSVVGSPTRESWAEGIQLANSCDYEFPLVPLAYAILSASGHAVNLIESLLSWDPTNSSGASLL
ncbi:hypothetical protein MKW94_000770 [Papaver nudicaule]|uniref:Protein kinase domain-containing protein n=1 Tax=Papaver nudicaule TaxID=74823 RepID=A0AA41V0I3_PAPNU|nr:hypothetical protein [Papaver nudicaule]